MRSEVLLPPWAWTMVRAMTTFSITWSLCDIGNSQKVGGSQVIGKCVCVCICGREWHADIFQNEGLIYDYGCI